MSRKRGFTGCLLAVQAVLRADRESGLAVLDLVLLEGGDALAAFARLLGPVGSEVIAAEEGGSTSHDCLGR